MRLAARTLPVLLLILATLPGCDTGEDVNVRTLAAARRAWDQARVRDYDLEWSSSGAQDARYRVFVRDGSVKAVRRVVREADGRSSEFAAKPGDVSYYGVEGLFKILDEERAQRWEASPFGQPKGTRVVLKFTPDPRLGYPRQFRRDVVGSAKGLAIDVIRFAPNSSAIPPLSTP